MGDGGDQCFAPEGFLDLSHTRHAGLFAPGGPVWAAIGRIGGYLAERDRFELAGEVSGRAVVGDRVHIGAGTEVEPGAVIKGPAWIGENCIVRSGAYLRENVIAGDGCVLGNSSEFKNCLLFDGVAAPHFNYVGDSILGHRAHLGAGVILSNVRLDGAEVGVGSGGERVGSGLRKFGAVIGDRAEVGCNSVINPGGVIGRDCVLYPGSLWSGVLASGHVVKVRGVQEVVAKREAGDPVK